MTDQELQIAMARMLPDKIDVHTWDSQVAGKSVTNICWRSNQNVVQDTEWLHACWLVEQELNENQQFKYSIEINARLGLSRARTVTTFDTTHASWQQRAEALIKVKGI